MCVLKYKKNMWTLIDQCSVERHTELKGSFALQVCLVLYLDAAFIWQFVDIFYDSAPYLVKDSVKYLWNY